MVLSSTCLQHLELYKISSLTAFPYIGLPTSLRSLKINECENLSFLPSETWNNYKSLVSLELWDSCHTLTSFPLEIYGCKSLESNFTSEISSSARASYLRSLYVAKCNALTSMPLQTDTLTALEDFSLEDCRAIRSLPQRMDTLTALESLTLSQLPELELSFSGGTCLPSKLWYISINSVGRTVTPVTTWGLHHLTALSNLAIGGNDNIVKTLLKEPLLPVSLLDLTIYSLSKMKSIEGNGLPHLSSLNKLLICFCSALESFPEDTLPSSLVEIEFYYCSKLESLPENSLPSSLKILRIGTCLLLEARYESQSGEHWPKISHISVIRINGEVTL